MQIGFDAKRAFHNYTGLGNYSRFILHALQKYYPENNYHLFTPSGRSNNETQVLLEHFEVHQPSGILSKPVLKSFWRTFLLGAEMKKANLDIYHCLSNELPLTTPDEVKKVVTIHDLIFLRYPDYFPLIDRKIYAAKFKNACHKADKIVAVSQQTKEDIIHFFDIDEEKIQVIYQGCHPNFSKEYSQKQLQLIRKKYALPAEFILNVGTVEKRKNALLILKALKKGDIKVPFIIIGKPTAYKKELESFIAANNLNDQVVFLHEVNFEDLPGIYDLSSLFIYPSVFEGFGIPIIEALQRKLPVITSKGSCFSEAGGALADYVDPINEEELAGAIKNKLQDSKEVINEDALEQHLSQFSSEKISSDYIKLYQSLLK